MDIGTIAQQLPSTLHKTKRQLRTVGRQAGVLSDDLRRLAHQLHPAILDVLGLTLALKTYVHEFSRSSGLQARFSSRKVPRELTSEVAGCVYRVVQEALRNVAKHAPNACVEVALSGTPTGLDLSIRDSGPGFDPDSLRAQSGLGLISMKERVHVVNGEFQLHTAPGAGVELEVHVPLGDI